MAPSTAIRRHETMPCSTPRADCSEGQVAFQASHSSQAPPGSGIGSCRQGRGGGAARRAATAAAPPLAPRGRGGGARGARGDGRGGAPRAARRKAGGGGEGGAARQVAPDPAQRE